jgi:hypothetical protein
VADFDFQLGGWESNQVENKIDVPYLDSSRTGGIEVSLRTSVSLTKCKFSYRAYRNTSQGECMG